MERSSTKKWDATAWEAYLVSHALSAGIANGALLSPEAFKALSQAQGELQRLREEDDKDKRPPKPPRGRLIGRIALGY